MKQYFENLKPGDTIYVVHNKNYDKKDANYNYLSFNSEEILTTGTVIKNKLETRTFSSGDYYDDIQYTKDEYYFEIETNSIKYNRYYDDFYNKRPSMTMTPNFLENGITIEVFIDKNDAQDYIETICNDRINWLQDEIQKRQQQIELYQQSIINSKNIL